MQSKFLIRLFVFWVKGHYVQQNIKTNILQGCSKRQLYMLTCWQWSNYARGFDNLEIYLMLDGKVQFYPKFSVIIKNVFQEAYMLYFTTCTS